MIGGNLLLMEAKSIRGTKTLKFKDMKKIISKKVALERAKEFWDYFMNSNYEALCFEDDGLSWQIRLDEDDEDEETFIISVEGYSEEHSDWVCRDDVVDIIYEFLNR